MGKNSKNDIITLKEFKKLEILQIGNSSTSLDFFNFSALQNLKKLYWCGKSIDKNFEFNFVLVDSEACNHVDSANLKELTSHIVIFV